MKRTGLSPKQQYAEASLEGFGFDFSFIQSQSGKQELMPATQRSL